jgi:hypothetical protein
MFDQRSAVFPWRIANTLGLLALVLALPFAVHAGSHRPRNVPPPPTSDPLTEAVRLGDEKAVMAELDRGADPRVQDREGCPLLMFCVGYGYANINIMRALLAHGADVNARTHDGQTALMHAVGPGSGRTGAEAIKLLLDAGAKLDLQTNFGYTALMYAEPRAEYLRLLLQKGADPNLRCGTGDTALMNAVRARNKDSVKLLLDKGADVTPVSDRDGLNAIEIATASGDREIARMLAEKGARPRLGDQWPVYKNTRYRYALSYPRGGYVEPADGTDHAITQASSIVITLPSVELPTDDETSEPNDSKCKVHLQVEPNPENLTVQAWLERHQDSDDPVPEPLSLHGRAAMRVKIDVFFGGRTYVYVPGEACIYSICLEPRDDVPKEIDAQYEQTFEKMLESFNVPD